ncbi:glutamine-hydrolyzing carbamoyl-phosphate synthase small subunit [Pontixanthobacter aestiaquae]|uniref:Carbamoyl phosphate synthase small chain n=1 Tax=Pontixanthobacter aestiaquae TaxID=1509367 RepID=A0A844Z945_9SPHN|nr:glutamine-hydrolyzing carbamoyl-phosphate synthase small subunit [Pontixanthobacter aestiaquae]MDN3645499.1 glutamine-hydrolyzing carbamoyl-phosphate synthase small subunit [Pontixanthobacter aestiaquae]MXO83503.1 glutamine-hydrolyzing carbamoyl-phosphate synthase small subunit [Pontixanthobacter aestiaquae]
MADAASTPAQPKDATGVLVLADGTVMWGRGFGANGDAVGEVCFNTSMTGYQEVMTDPSYAAQIVTFTFPHIGNVGANGEDIEGKVESAVGCVVREDVTMAANFRSEQTFTDWMAANNKIGISGIDTRALTRRIRQSGAPNAVIAHSAEGQFDIPALLKRAQEWAGLEGMDLAQRVTRGNQENWEGGYWTLEAGYGRAARDATPHVVAIDYGAKDNIFRNLVKAGAKVTVVPAKTSFDDIMALKPDAVFLSNGPGDPAATGAYAVPVIKALLDKDVPLFGICLGHQMLALAAGAKTTKMHQGHRGANHPVQRVGEGWGETTGLVEITSMNHGFAVDGDTLPDGVEETHVSLFDGSNCGIAVKGKKAFGVQYHPEASPGPQDSFYLFEKFVGGLG